MQVWENVVSESCAGDLRGTNAKVRTVRVERNIPKDVASTERLGDEMSRDYRSFYKQHILAVMEQDFHPHQPESQSLNGSFVHPSTVPVPWLMRHYLDPYMRDVDARSGTILPRQVAILMSPESWSRLLDLWINQTRDGDLDVEAKRILGHPVEMAEGLEYGRADVVFRDHAGFPPDESGRVGRSPLWGDQSTICVDVITPFGVSVQGTTDPAWDRLVYQSQIAIRINDTTGYRLDGIFG